jgi:hypothetical protein
MPSKKLLPDDGKDAGTFVNPIAFGLDARVHIMSRKECRIMTESGTLDKTIKTFLLGVSVGTILTTLLKPRGEEKHPSKPQRDVVDTASEDSFPASDPPGY